MRCPFCKAADTSVIDSRMSDDGDSVRRRRECKSCDKRFTTYERVEMSMPLVVKANGYRTSYDRNKIRTGFMRALHKRPVPAEQVEEAINRIEQRVLALGEREVKSRVVGELVMRELKKLDDVAYIRFASVYGDFQRVDDFRDAILQVKRPAKRIRSAGR
jgi:transcriptional repressor NrdR